MSANRPRLSGSFGRSSQSARPSRSASAHSAQASLDRFVTDCRQVALVENEIDYGLNRRQSFREVQWFIGNVPFLDLALGTLQTLSEHWCWQQRRPSNLRCLQSAQRV